MWDVYVMIIGTSLIDQVALIIFLFGILGLLIYHVYQTLKNPGVIV